MEVQAATIAHEMISGRRQAMLLAQAGAYKSVGSRRLKALANAMHEQSILDAGIIQQLVEECQRLRQEAKP